MTINVRPLNERDFNDLHECWCAAFGDYQVKLDLSPSDLNTMLTQNGFSYAASVAAFQDGRMVGFLLNGLRTYNGALTAYDTGTAIIPDFRGKGLSGQMFAEVEKVLHEKDVKRYLLEVLQENKRAYNVYLKNGFAIVREFNCLEACADAFKATVQDITITPSSFNDCLPLIPTMLEYNPSWQHKTEALQAIKNTLNFYTARIGNAAVGYCVFQPSRKRILQIGAAPSHREKGVYEALFGRLFADLGDQGKIMAINIPPDAAQLTRTFKNCGFKSFVDQYEMVKIYPPSALTDCSGNVEMYLKT